MKRSKSEWALAKAKECEKLAEEVMSQPGSGTASDYAGRAQRREGLLKRAGELRSISNHYKSKGL